MLDAQGHPKEVAVLITVLFVEVLILGLISWSLLRSGGCMKTNPVNSMTTKVAQKELRAILVCFYAALGFCVAVSFFGLLVVGKDGGGASFYFFMCWGISTPVAYFAGRFAPQRCATKRHCFLPSGALDRSFMRLSFSWRRQWRATSLAYLLPALAALFAYMVTILIGVADANLEFIATTTSPRLTLSGCSEPVQLIGYSLYAVFLGSVWDLTAPPTADFAGRTSGGHLGTSWVLLTFLEEIAWSGLLYPTLRRWFVGPKGFLWSWIAMSTVWVTWHSPFLLFAAQLPEDIGYEAGARSTPLAWGFTGFALDLFLARLIMCLIVEADATAVLPCTLFHAAHNMLIESFAMQMLKAPEGDFVGKTTVFSFFVGEASVLQIFSYAAVVVWILRYAPFSLIDSTMLEDVDATSSEFHHSRFEADI